MIYFTWQNVGMLTVRRESKVTKKEKQKKAREAMREINEQKHKTYL
jgi:hypothetical protein